MRLSCAGGDPHCTSAARSDAEALRAVVANTLRRHSASAGQSQNTPLVESYQEERNEGNCLNLALVPALDLARVGVQAPGAVHLYRRGIPDIMIRPDLSGSPEPVVRRPYGDY